MRFYQITVFLTVSIFMLLMPAQGWAQGTVIIRDCDGMDSQGSSLQGCYEFDEDMLDYSQQLASTALDFGGLLPDGLTLYVVFNYDDKVDYQYIEGVHVITVGESKLIDFWNSYADIWDLYDYEGDPYDTDEDFIAFTEWVLYHEIGHALITYSQNTHGFGYTDKDHEVLADDFATIAMINLHTQGQGSRHAVQAAQGLFFLSLPDAQRTPRAGSNNTRNAFAQKAPKKKKQTKRRGAEGNDGVHQPNTRRAWEVACLVYGSGQGSPPEDYPVDSDYGLYCADDHYAKTLEEWREYMP